MRGKQSNSSSQCFTTRKATLADLPVILKLLYEDKLGETRELFPTEEVAACYRKAFQRIEADPHQYLMVVEEVKTPTVSSVVGTCHLTLMPSLTLQGALRLNVEAVRIASSHRGRGIGRWMFEQVFAYAKAQGASLIQLTTDKRRSDAKRFYEGLGFEVTHEGMKKRINLSL